MKTQTKSMSVIVLTILTAIFVFNSCAEEPATAVEGLSSFTSIGGIVTTTSGSPIEGAKITTTIPATSEVYTDSKGYYVLKNLYTTNFTITVQKAGFAINNQQLSSIKNTFAHFNISLIELGKIQGVVKNAQNIPIAAVRITTTPATKEVYTDNSGNYLVESINAGTYTVTAYKENFVNQSKQTTVQDGQTSKVDFGLLTYGSIGGLVTDAGSNAIEGVRITTTPASKEVFTAAGGNYLIESINAGTYTVTAYKEKFVNQSKQTTVQGGQTSKVDFGLLTYGSIGGLVTDAGSNAIEGVRITTTPASKEVFTDAGGNYLIESINAGTYTVAAFKDNFVNQNKQTTVQDGQINILDFNLLMVGEIPEGFVFVEGGVFQMGSTSGDSDEQPVHTVTLSNFYISKYEVTQKQWREVMGTNPSYFSGDDKPVEQVTWYDAVAFCNALSEKVGLEKCYSGSGTSIIYDFTKNGYRLPTEAEWEYAARGGNQSNGYTYSGSNSIGGVAWYSSNSGNTTHNVGTKTSNELGIYDMSGNVWEWCNDWYSDNYYSNSPGNNPKGPASGTSRVLRGGSWLSYDNNCRVSNRTGGYPDYPYYNNGFRIVQDSL
ncbi:MAG: SUMF1/EgtB/PvdO family nonheme iron enzyme [Bacteroidetes bacterium]|nr:SUMF1/EgtB/PvdO family nonheme iron enzyme [Bacteroidota bacterium]